MSAAFDQTLTNFAARCDGDEAYERLERLFKLSLRQAGPDGLVVAVGDTEKPLPSIKRIPLAGGAVRYVADEHGS